MQLCIVRSQNEGDILDFKCATVRLLKMAFSESNLKCNLNNPGNSSMFTIKHTFTLSHSVRFAQMTNKSHNILCLHRITFMLCQEILRSAGLGGHLKVPWKRERISKEPFSLRSTLDYLYLRKRKRKSPGLCNYFSFTLDFRWQLHGCGNITGMG